MTFVSKLYPRRNPRTVEIKKRCSYFLSRPLKREGRSDYDIVFFSTAQKTLLSFVPFHAISEHVISLHREILWSKKTWKTRYSRENIMKHIHLLLVCNWRHYGNHVGGQEQKYFYSLGTKLYSNTNSLKYFYCIHHFYRDHDAPCSPPNFCTTIVFNFSLACSRLLDSSLLAEAGTKVKREENWGEKGLFPATTPLSHIT